MLYILRSTEGQLAVVQSLKRFVRIMELDAVAATFVGYSVVASLPVVVRQSGVNALVRATVESLGAVYPNPWQSGLAIVTEAGEVLKCGDIGHLARWVGIPPERCQTSYLKGLPLERGGWIVTPPVRVRQDVPGVS